jgi:uncharacterized protein DUF3857
VRARRLGLASIFPLLALLLSLPLAAADFPPITDEERALTAVPGEPNAAAVVLFRKGEFLMMGFGFVTGSLASHLRVQGRVKILTEAGKSNGEIVVAHSDFTRLASFEGRTVLPDGRIVPVPPDAKFVSKTSLSRRTLLTAVAFPAVEVGAILDYQYELVFKSPFLLDPWYFSETIPVRDSEIVFKSASGWRMTPWSRSPFGVKIQREEQKTSSGDVLRAWAESLPPVPDDPYGPPYADLATQILLLPASRTLGAYQSQPLLATWASASWLLAITYQDVRHRDFGVAQQARRIAASGTQRQKAEALYRFIRDEVETETEPGVFVDPDAALREILSRRRATPAEKALLLQAMLKAVQIDSTLVWAADRNRRTPDLGLPNPSWFNTMLVTLELDGTRIFLDPTDRALGFGQLQAGHEATPALVPGIGGVRGIVLPEAPFQDNGRRAEIDLTLDDKGRLTGTGTLRLTGHHAREMIGQDWSAWLVAERYRDFQISDVKAVETPDERKIVVTWSMAQREEETLGDESSLVPSAPLGPVRQPFVQPSSSRKTMVMFDYADRTEVELRLRWPAGWKIESLPKPAALKNGVGEVAVSLEAQETSLVFRRRFDLTRWLLRSSQEYEAAQALFAAVERSDAQSVVLVRR